MKKLLQNLKTGKTYLEDVPKPALSSGSVLIKTSRSLISLGTEKMLVSFGQSNLISKARQQPEKVKQVLEKIKSDGLQPTLEAVFSRLDEPLPLGYCNAGTVIEVGKGITDISVGERVICNGPHAEIVSVPRNLVAKIPEGISFDEASFTVLASIGLEGLRLAKPELGEICVIIGLGLIGQITAQLVKANGCRVIGFDIDNDKIKKAAEFGIEAFNSSENDPVKTVLGLTSGIGSDIVLITASSKSNDIISQSANMCRKRGRVILIGVIGLQLNRADFYEKEITFQVSCSYGPGRYDASYEEHGCDYPLPFVRWTENRNFQAILECISKGSLNVRSLITDTVDFKDTPELYSKLSESKSLATIIKYADTVDLSTSVPIKHPSDRSVSGKGTNPVLGIIGAGLFTKATMLPALAKTDAGIKYICSRGGASSTHLARKFSIEKSTTDIKIVLDDKSVDAVIITTRHDLHASMVIDSVKAGKHVFVEKPLCLNQTELGNIISTIQQLNNSTTQPSITVGFNRRFSPLTIKLKKLLGSSPGPINAVLTFNAGAIPKSHWTQDPDVGGGRIIGEACHFIDLFTFLASSPVTSICASNLGVESDTMSDNVSILLKCANGSQASCNYFSNGSKAWPKEFIEVYSQGRVARIDNFRMLSATGFKGFSRVKPARQDKGHRAQFTEYVRFLKHGGDAPIPFSQIVNTTRATFAVLKSLQTGALVNIS